MLLPKSLILVLMLEMVEYDGSCVTENVKIGIKLVNKTVVRMLMKLLMSVFVNCN